MTMTQKEKATRYDEALKEAVIAHKDEDKHLKATLERIFPELKVSEGEKIRKDLIEWIKEFPDPVWRGHHKKDIIAWLEKQAQKPANKVEPKFRIGDIIKFKGNETLKGETETHKIVGYDNELYVFDDGTTDLFCEQDLYELVEQKPTDKVKQKFHKGDWVVTTYGKVNQIVSVDKDGDGYTLDNGVYFSGSWCDMYHLWTINDAADGDLLVSDCNQPFIYNGHFDTFNVGAYCGLNCTGEDFLISNELCDWTNNINIKPANKEERVKLEKEMADAGFTFDFNKKKLKELKKIEHNPAWSEDDKNFMYDTLSNLTELKDRYGESYGNVGKCIDWIKSLKDRCT